MVGGSGGHPPNGANGPDMENVAGSDVIIPEAEDMLTVQRRIAEAERFKDGGKGDESNVIRTSFFTETTMNTTSSHNHNATDQNNRKITIWQRFFRCQQHPYNATTISVSAGNAAGAGNSKEVLVKPSVLIHPLA